jgi:hypothetical protein
MTETTIFRSIRESLHARQARRRHRQQLRDLPDRVRHSDHLMQDIGLR